MLLVLGILLAIAWLTGLVVFKVASVAFHVLIVLAVIGVVLHFVRGAGKSKTG